MNWSRPARALALAVAALLSGCSLMTLKAPSITPESVMLTDLRLDQQEFDVRLHVDNPNDRPLPIKSVTCTLEVEGIEVGKAASAAPFNVPALGSTEFDLHVTTNFASSVPNLLRRVLERGQLPEYHFSGWVNPDEALLPPIPFSKSGQIQAQQLQLQ
jgi:LEA14-like dessication related protein